MPTNQHIYTVSRLNHSVRSLLENEMGVIWLVGELSSFTRPVSGHWYFTLKDAQAQVKCAMFRGNNSRVAFQPQSGQKVLVRARISLYEPRGDYQLIVESMQPEGDGEKQQAFEQLKMKLAAEGLFSQQRKRTIPNHPQTLGIVTSQTGAALQDILTILKRRDPSLPIIIYPCIVQGENAGITIAQTIGLANERNECDVLIVGRGGGSTEDLWCFNDEVLARTIAASHIPIISAVGHEIDVTIADFVADVRAPTPSAAAEMVSRDLDNRSHQLQQLEQKLHLFMGHQLSQAKTQLQQLTHRVEKQHPSYQLQQKSQQLDELTQRMSYAIQHGLHKQQSRLDSATHRHYSASPQRIIDQHKTHLYNLEQSLSHHFKQVQTNKQHQFSLLLEKLDMMSPLATLSRGYSITKNKDGKVVTQASEVTTGDILLTQTSDGEIVSQVQ